MIETIYMPPDPRLAPVAELRRIVPLPGKDAEAKDERRLLHRIDLKDAVRR